MKIKLKVNACSLCILFLSLMNCTSKSNIVAPVKNVETDTLPDHTAQAIDISGTYEVEESNLEGNSYFYHKLIIKKSENKFVGTFIVGDYLSHTNEYYTMPATTLEGIIEIEINEDTSGIFRLTIKESYIDPEHTNMLGLIDNGQAILSTTWKFTFTNEQLITETLVGLKMIWTKKIN